MAKNIIIYSSPLCPYCKMLKKYLAEKNITYTDYNVIDDQEKAQEMINKSGQMGIPVIDIDGKLIIGFDQEAINRELGL